MKLTYQKVRQRLLTIVLYGPLTIFAVYLGELPFFVMIMLMAFLSIQEMYTMYSLGRALGEHYYIGHLFSVLLISSAYMADFNPFWQHNIVSALTILAIVYFIFELCRKKIFFMENANYYILRAVIYIGLLYSYMILLRNMPDGLDYIIYLVSVVWTNDIFAYLIGLPLGKHKLSPAVSPKKSIEGAFGALLGAVLMSVNIRFLLGIPVGKAIVVGVIVSVLAQVGDLVESLLKRELKAKDSGSILPGHGGILDRIDSFILTVPIFYLFVHYIIL